MGNFSFYMGYENCKIIVDFSNVSFKKKIFIRRLNRQNLQCKKGTLPKNDK